VGRHGVSVLRVRHRLVRLAFTLALVVSTSSLAHSEWEFSHDTADASAFAPGIVLAARVASVTTRNAIMISVTAPSGQPAGVIYAVTRVTGNTMTTVCTGSAPLHCTDTVRPGGQAVSYTVSSTLAGEGTATTTVDVTAPPRTVPTEATEPTRRVRPRRTASTRRTPPGRTPPPSGP
jgi:hypothetical protein